MKVKKRFKNLIDKVLSADVARFPAFVHSYLRDWRQGVRTQGSAIAATYKCQVALSEGETPELLAAFCLIAASKLCFDQHGGEAWFLREEDVTLRSGRFEESQALHVLALLDEAESHITTVKGEPHVFAAN